MVVANSAHARVPRIYQHPGQRPEYTARPRSRKRPLVNLRSVRGILAGMLVLALALLVIFRYGQISHINLNINKDTNTLNALADEQRHLKLSIAELTGLERLEQFALELGMRYPHPEQFRFVGENYPESGDGDGE